MLVGKRDNEFLVFQLPQIDPRVGKIVPAHRLFLDRASLGDHKHAVGWDQHMLSDRLSQLIVEQHGKVDHIVLQQPPNDAGGILIQLQLDPRKFLIKYRQHTAQHQLRIAYLKPHAKPSAPRVRQPVHFLVHVLTQGQHSLLPVEVALTRIGQHKLLPHSVKELHAQRALHLLHVLAQGRRRDIHSLRRLENASLLCDRFDVHILTFHKCPPLF